MGRLTGSMRRVLDQAPADWGKLPPGVGCTNSTLEALERRGLVETRLTPGQKYYGLLGRADWQWRRPPAAVQGETTP